MKDCFDTAAKDLSHHVVVSDVGDDQSRRIRNGVGMTGAEVVNDDDLVAVFQQSGRDDASDIAGAAGDKELHAVKQTLAVLAG